MIPQERHLGHSLPEISRWRLGTSVLRVPDLLLCPSLPRWSWSWTPLGLCHGDKAQLDTQQQRAPQEQQTPTAAVPAPAGFNPGFGAIGNHRKGKNPSQNPTHVVIATRSSFKKTQDQNTDSCPVLSSWQLHCWITQHLLLAQVSNLHSWNSLRVKVGCFVSFKRLSLCDGSALQTSPSCANTYLEKQ